MTIRRFLPLGLLLAGLAAASALAQGKVPAAPPDFQSIRDSVAYIRTLPR